MMQTNVMRPFLLLALVAAVLIVTLLSLRAFGPGETQLAFPRAPEVAGASLKPLLAPGDVTEKKQRFFALLKPLTEIENDYIRRQRQWLQAQDLQMRTPALEQGLLALREQYLPEIETDEPLPGPMELEGLRQALLARIHPLPVEMVLVQAANESAWGRSRFAQEGNNLFGQWCFSKGCGLVPRERTEGSYHEVAAFRSPQLSIRGYLNNLNRFWAYEGLREARAGLLAQPTPPDSYTLSMHLISHLQRYSERGEHYVRELKAMVKANKTLIDAAPGANLR